MSRHLRAEGPLRAADSPQQHREATDYHAMLAKVCRAQGEGRLDNCREGCLQLLAHPHLPKFTRIQTLQMVSKLIPDDQAGADFRQAGALLQTIDGFQARLLQEDNYKMFGELKVSIKGDVGSEALQDQVEQCQREILSCQKKIQERQRQVDVLQRGIQERFPRIEKLCSIRQYRA